MPCSSQAPPSAAVVSAIDYRRHQGRIAPAGAPGNRWFGSTLTPTHFLSENRAAPPCRFKRGDPFC
jgi:hypothetical protein